MMLELIVMKINALGVSANMFPQCRHEDELRVEHLQGIVFETPLLYTANWRAGDDSIFDDLKISKNDYPKVPTTW
jgi:hypothetical protein